MVVQRKGITPKTPFISSVASRKGNVWSIARQRVKREVQNQSKGRQKLRSLFTRSFNKRKIFTGRKFSTFSCRVTRGKSYYLDKMLKGEAKN